MSFIVRTYFDVFFMSYSPDYIGELFNFANKGYSLRNADCDIPRYSTVRYGKHSIRYLGPYLWSRLFSSDRQRPSLNNFRRNIRKKELTSFVEGTCTNCNLRSNFITFLIKIIKIREYCKYQFFIGTKRYQICEECHCKFSKQAINIRSIPILVFFLFCIRSVLLVSTIS